MGHWQRLYLGLGAVLFLTGFPTITNAEGSIGLVIEGKPVTTEAPPQIVNDRTLVPIRVISEGIGANVNWDAQSQVVNIQKDQTKIQIPIGGQDSVVNGTQVQLDSPAQIIQDRTFVPLRFVSENLGINVTWDGVSRTVFASKPITIRFNGKNLQLQDHVIKMGDGLYLPLMDLQPTLGIQVTSNNNDPSHASLSFQGKNFTIDAKQNNEDNWFARVINNQLVVPLSQVQKKLQLTMKVDTAKQRVDLFQLINPDTYQSPALPKEFQGNFIFIWKAENIQQGDIQKMIGQAKQLGVTGVMIKFANGSLVDDPVSQKYMDQFKKLAGPFKAAGFKVGGWIYQYLTDVPGEVDACSQAINAGADFIILDGEDELIGKNQQAAQFGKLFRAKYPNVKLGFSSYAFSHTHSDIPFGEYNQFVDVMMPQIYWDDMKWDVEDAFNVSMTAYSKFGKPILVTGQLYDQAKPQDISRFIQLNNRYKLSGISWWDWDEATPEQLKAAMPGVTAK